jgi:hypothetical protein
MTTDTIGAAELAARSFVGLNVGDALKGCRMG